MSRYVPDPVKAVVRFVRARREVRVLREQNAILLQQLDEAQRIAHLMRGTRQHYAKLYTDLVHEFRTGRAIFRSQGWR